MADNARKQRFSVKSRFPALARSEAMLTSAIDLHFQICADAGASALAGKGATVARVGDFDKPPQVSTPKRSKKRKTRKSSEPRAKTSAPAKRIVKTVTVEVLGVTYVGWYWVEHERLYVTYHQQPKPAQTRCGCCAPTLME